MNQDNIESDKKPVVAIAVIVVVLVAAVAAYLFLRPVDKATETIATPTTSQGPTDEHVMANPDVTMIYFTDNGFNPTDYTVRVGAKIMIMNQSKTDLEFSSADHPTHKENSELNLPLLKPGESREIVLTKAGSWGFHDHLHDQYTGKLIVTE